MESGNRNSNWNSLVKLWSETIKMFIKDRRKMWTLGAKQLRLPNKVCGNIQESQEIIFGIFLLTNNWMWGIAKLYVYI